MPTQKTIPPSALMFHVGPVELGDNGDDAASAPLHLVARSRDVLNHFWWGACVHDFDGMIGKDKIPVDYAHDSDQIVGYANRREITDRGLELWGAITPHGENQTARKLVADSKAGVPYEASINFASHDMVVEEVPAGQTAEANGRTYPGPVAVFRKWRLRGVAVCPCGYDPATEANFASAGKLTIELVDRNEDTMSNQDPPVAEAPVDAPDSDPAVADEADDQAVDATNSDAPAEGDPVDAGATGEETDAAATDAATDQAGDDADPAGEPAADADADPVDPDSIDQAELDSDRAAEGARFTEAFGDDLGPQWFAQGLTFDQAHEQYVLHLAARNRELEQTVAQLGGGEAEPVTASEPPAGEAGDQAGESRRAAAQSYRDKGMPTAEAEFAAMFDARGGKPLRRRT